MKTQFTTESGSTYTFDSATRIWERISKGKTSGSLRSISGVVTEDPVIVTGRRVDFCCPPFTEGFTGRLVSTSFVTSITVLEESNALDAVAAD